MKSEPIMLIKVYGNDSEVSNLECAYGAVTMIPFRRIGTVFRRDPSGSRGCADREPRHEQADVRKIHVQGKGLCRKRVSAVCKK